MPANLLLLPLPGQVEQQLLIDVPLLARVGSVGLVSHLACGAPAGRRNGAASVGGLTMQANKLLRDTHKVFGTHTLRPYKVKNRRDAVSLRISI